MDFLYRNIHMEQRKWDAATQMTIEEDMNVPDAKGDCLAVLLKDASLHVEETRAGRDQVVIKGALQYQILYTTETGTKLEQLSGSIPFEEVLNVNGAAPGDFAAAKGVIEDFKVTLINTRKISIQSVVMLYACMHQMLEEEWTFDVVNCGNDMQKQFESRQVLQLCQKKSDVFRIREEAELPGGYPAIQHILWKRITLGNVESRPLDGKLSLKGELNCYFIYTPQGAGQSVKMWSKTVPFHGFVDCSGCGSDMILSVIPVLNQYSAEVKADFDGEDRIIYLDAALELQIRVYQEEKLELLKDMYSTSQEAEVTPKTVNAPVLYIAGEGKCKLKQTHRLKEGAARAVQLLHTCATVFPDREVWENGKLSLMGGVQVQVLYLTGDEEMPYAVTECVVPYTLEMEGISGEQAAEKPTVLIEPRIEQMESVLSDSEEMEIKGILAFSVLVMSSQEQECVGSAECKPLNTEQFAVLPSMVVCFAEQDTPLWEYGKHYYMSIEEMKKLNGLGDASLKAGNSMLLVKGGREAGIDKMA